nr:phage tail protein [Streptococcus uberis]
MTQFLKGACSFVTIKYRSKDAEKVRAGCKLAFRHKGKDYWLTINEFSKKGTEVEITAYSLSLEANKEKRGAYKASSAMSIVDYFSVFDPEKSLEIGINEVSDKKLTLEWTGTDTVLARLYSIANSFDAEIEFVTELNPNYSLKRHVVNIYRSGNLGGDSTGRPVRVGTELKVLGFNSNINDLYTAIDVTGKDGLRLPDKTIKDAKGEVQFFSKNGRLYAPQARDKFPSNKVNTQDGYILAEAKTTEYTNQEALFGYALSEMKKHCDVQVEYSTEGAVKGSVGDTKTLIDAINFEPTLYVRARITEQTEDLETGKSLKTTFSNFKRTSSQLSSDLTKRIEELAKSAVPYRIVMVTSNGTSFKNGTGQSVVSPKLFKGDVEITDATYRFNFNNNTVAGLNYTVNASAVNGTSVLKIDAYVGNDVVANDELTFINVNDGVNGSKGADGNGIASTAITYQAGTSATVAPTGTWSSSPVSVPAGQYLWTRTIFTYTDTTTKTIYNVSRQGQDGAKGADGIAGKDGVGISSTVITYGLSANETTQPTTWTANPPTLVKGQYLWTKTVWTYTDAKTETGYTKTYIAKDGNNGADGIAGKDGVGILSTSITYQASTSGTVVPTGTWSSQVPSVPNGQFLWTRTIWNYTDSTSETGYSVAKMGTDGTDGLSAYTHVAYANKSTDVLVDAMTTFAVPASFSGSTLTSTKISSGYKFTSTGGNSYTKQVVGFSGTTGKNVYTYLIIKNTHATNDIVVSFNGIGAVLNENFSNVTVKPGQTYVDYRPAICRDTYNFLQISIGSTAISNDLSYEIYDYALYNTNPFINFSLDVNPNCRFRGEYQDNNQTASADPTKYKWVNMVGTVDVGGRNYLTKSNPIRDAGANKLNALSVRDAETPNGFKVTGNQTKDGVVRLHNVINSDGWWTVSFDIKGSQSLAVDVTIDICDQGQTKIWTNATNTYERKSISVNVTNYSKNPSTYHFVDFSNFAFAYFWIDNIKIEKGNMPTDYSEAPEDVQAVIDANQALTQAQMLALEERSALARDNAIAEAMKNTISEVEAKWQTWYNLNTADEKQKVANDIASLFDRVAKFEQNLGEASAKFEFINNETLIGEEGVAIGDKEGKAKLFLSNDSISFVTNGVAQMTLTGDTLTIKNGLFTERIQIGNYVEEVYDRNPLYNVIRPIKYS